jgi:hypothetical protein
MSLFFQFSFRKCEGVNIVFFVEDLDVCVKQSFLVGVAVGDCVGWEFVIALSFLVGVLDDRGPRRKMDI